MDKKETIYIPEDPDTNEAVAIIEDLFFGVYGENEEAARKLRRALEYLADTGSLRFVPVEGGMN